MLKKWAKTLLMMVIVFLGISYINAQTHQPIGYGGKIYDFSRTNSQIHFFILQQSDGAFGFGPLGIDFYKSNMDYMILSLQGLTDEMEQTSAPKRYKQAHKELLRAYQNFLAAVIVYQKAINKDGITTSNLEGVISTYPQITEASEKWYTIYKKRLEIPLIQDNSQFTALGNIQDRMLYIDSTQSRIKATLDTIESNLLPWVDKKDYDGVYKMQGGQIHDLPMMIFYMNILKVPEPFSTAHQHVLGTYENFYNLMKDSQYHQINDEYLEKLKSGYEDIKKASEEWNLVLQQQS